MGKAVFNITLGSLTLDSELIVAEIEDEALLGLDILMKGKGGPADIKLTEGLILLDGIAIPCTQIGQRQEAIATGYFSTKKLFGSNK
jgi:hypothetical protein